MITYANNGKVQDAFCGSGSHRARKISVTRGSHRYMIGWSYPLLVRQTGQGYVTYPVN